ncbi:hypothetical protein [Actinokineospora bangkokensis]|uniref:Uncharacterized protein n=1 Tax=Actinokineospora bangkokensis TaxID=1193682 RepID=A0A1Q9LR45_9PSEU|nr:hypothetical protein [Actinokineospora bangkokensis]OLR94461.1 hypothetical protein BJP25_11960 [Actinokineospora bangkokensis]
MNISTQIPLVHRPVTPVDRRRAARHAASAAHDADDLRSLLAALGLTAADGLADPAPGGAAAPDDPAPAPAGPPDQGTRALGAALLTQVGSALSGARR